jgi:DNA-binding MarR family transcriptional regulator
MTSLELDNFIPYRLSVASNAVSDVIARAYADLFGLRVPEWRVLAILAHSPGLTPQAVCARGAMDKITVSRAAQGLLARSLIAATDNPKDKRSHCLTLTQTGEELYRTVVPTALALEQQLLSALSADEALYLRALLRKVETAALSIETDSPLSPLR